MAGFLAGQAIVLAEPSGGDEDYNTIKLYKNVVQTDEGKYVVNLEAFVTGTSVVTSSTKPVDIALVLDRSSSMNHNYVTIWGDYKASSKTTLTYDEAETKYYYKVDGEYYEIKRERTNGHSRSYYLYYQIGGKYYYFREGGTISTTKNGSGVGKSDTPIFNNQGTLYTRESIRKKRMEVLKEATVAFINTVANSAKGLDGQFGTVDGKNDDIPHQISIHVFDGGASTEQHFTELNSQSSVNSLIETVNGLDTGRGTCQDLGLSKARTEFDSLSDSRKQKSAKVVVMFTDGEPYTDGTRGDGITSSAAIRDNAINISHGMKDAYDATVYTIGVFDSPLTPGSSNDLFMHYTSSEYPDATSMSNPGAVRTDGKLFYQESDGSDLTAIFEQIASEATADVIDLHENSASVIDIVSSNFVIPSTVTSANVSLAIHRVDSYNADYKDIDYYERDGVKYYYGYTFVEDAEYLAAHTPSVVRNENTISVTGFDFALGDTIDESTGAITSYGNFVGERDVEGVKTYAGRKIVISFPIELSPDYQGGYLMPSNDIHSGIWVDGDLVKPFPRPMVDFPSICIVKHGLMVGESAIFKVTGTYVAEEGGTEQTVSYNVVLTQKATAQGAKLPCYAVLKRLYSGRYTVEETNWSWMYQPDSNINSGRTNISFDILPADQVGVTYDLLANGADLTNNGEVVGKTATKTVGSVSMPFVMLKDSAGGYDDSAISVLYEFGNVRKTSGKPARAEAWAHNKFKGGTANTGGSESGTSEEEEGL